MAGSVDGSFRFASALTTAARTSHFSSFGAFVYARADFGSGSPISLEAAAVRTGDTVSFLTIFNPQG